MVKCLRQIGKKIIGLVCKLIDSIIYILPVYYTSIEKISLKRYFDLQSGDYHSLYKINLKRIPDFFYNIPIEMMYQFDKLDLTIIKMIGDLAVLKNMAARNQDKTMQFQADVMETEIKALMKKNKDSKPLTLNSFIDYIEMTFDSIGKLDPEKLSASRGFSLFHKAVERNEHIQKMMK